jgi:hypothetical protein
MPQLIPDPDWQEFENTIESLTKLDMIAKDFLDQTHRDWREIRFHGNEFLHNEFLDLEERALEDWFESANETDAAWSDESRGGFETLAWYQPLSFYGKSAGIYITVRGIRYCGSRFLRALKRGGIPRSEAIRASFVGAIVQLLTHEGFHHKVEWMAIRLDGTFGLRRLGGMHGSGNSRYIEYHESVYRPMFSSPGALEEALASASEYRDFPTHLGSHSFNPLTRKLIRQEIRESYSSRPNGYQDAPGYISKGDFAAGAAELIGQINKPRSTGPVERDLPLLGLQRSELSSFFANTWTLVDDGFSGGRVPFPLP